ncbi:hypothetical protein LSAT2_021458 [Lamellibrachia satsuma]|nr:hypothetical protein LSAT2_021458 [Lamellibrachia satsuma]
MMNCSKRNVEKALNDDGCKDNCVLPPNWVVCKSQRKKRLYYFNKITGKSTWHLPSNGKASGTSAYMIETSQAVGKPGKESTNSISPKSVRKLSKTEKTRKTKKQKVQPSEKNVGKCETRRTFTGHRVVSSASVDSGKIYSGKVDSGKGRITAVVSTGGKGKGNGKGNAWKMVGKRRVGTAVGRPRTLAKKCGLLKDQSIKSVVTDSDERTDRWMCETVIPGTPSYKRHLDGTVPEESSLSTQHDGWTLCDVLVKVATTSRKHSFTWSGKAQKQGTLAKKCGLFEDQSINSTVTDSDKCTDGWICETVKPGTPSYKCHPDGTVPQDSALSTQHGGWTLSAMPPVRVDTKLASNSFLGKHRDREHWPRNMGYLKTRV